MADEVVTTYAARFLAQGQDVVDKAFKKVAKSVNEYKQEATKTAEGTEKLQRNLGDLSEQLDKKLEQSFGRVFKVTDRLNGILGQVTAAFGLLGLAVTAAVSIYQYFADETEDTEEALKAQEEAVKAATAVVEKYREELARSTAAASAFAGATGETAALLSLEVRREIDKWSQAQAIASENVEKLTKTINDEKDAIDELRASAERYNQTHYFDPKQVEIREREKGIRQLRKLLDENKKALQDADAQLEGLKPQGPPVPPPKPPKPPGPRPERDLRGFDVGGAGIAAAGFFSPAIDAATKNLIDRNDEILRQGYGLGDVYRDLGTDLQGLTSDVDRFTASLAEQVAQAEAAAQAYNKLSDFGAQAGTDLAGAAVDAAIFGQSLEQSLNALAQKTLREAAINAIVETAKGFGALGTTFGIPNPASTAHFTSAAIWGGIAAGSGIVAAATGGIGANAGGGGGKSALDAYGPPTSRDVGGRDRDRGPVELTINANFNGIYTGGEVRREVGRIAASALREAEYERGRLRFNADAFAH